MTQITNTVPKSDPTDQDDNAPVVLDLGKKSRKQVRRLRKGKGKLMDKINEVVEELRADGNIAASAQPVIIVVRQRDKKTSLFGL